jgi:hypothetical protein
VRRSGRTEVKLGSGVRSALVASRASGDLIVTFWGTVIVTGLIAGFWAFASNVDPDTWVPVLVFGSLILISVPICYRLSSAGMPAGARDHKLLRILLLGLSLKMLAVFPRYYVNESLYKGQTDAGQYDNAGKVFVANAKKGRLSLDGSFINKFNHETRNVGYVAGALYLAFGTSYMGGYMAFTWLSWLGLVFALKAFRVAYPNAPPYFAARLLFFLPSMLYWPSSLGKDALMVFCLGALALGVARILTPSHPVRGLLITASAGYLISLVRPHLLLISILAIAASLLARNAAKQRAGAALGGRVLLIILLIPALFFGLSQVNNLFGKASDGATVSITTALDQTKNQTSIGGSSFEAKPISSPLDVPGATVSVLYRPFLFEASSLPVLISAIEGTILLMGTLLFARWIWRIGPAMWRHPFSAFCGAYTLCFIFAFSNIGNAGILARQRVQMFPFLLVLVAAAREQQRLHEYSLQTLSEVAPVDAFSPAGDLGAPLAPTWPSTPI